MGDKIRPNISFKEAECPCCGTLPSDRYLDIFQEIRRLCGFPLPFTSMYRCPKYNRDIGGSELSAHLLCANSGIHGAADIGISKKQSRQRWMILAAAVSLGFNNLEVCDKHLHIGFAPVGHAMYNKLYWGVSK